MDVNLKKSNSSIDSQKNEVWELESGKWQQESSGLGFKLVETNTGQKVSNHLTNADLQVILNLPKHPENEDWLYPPEFKHCTKTGVELKRQVLSEEKPWIPPFGVLPINERKTGVVRGLNQSDFEFELEFDQKSQEILLKKTLYKPSTGNYQFFSIKSKTKKNILIAIDPMSGDIYANVTEKNNWYYLTSFGDSLSGTNIDLKLWRCEAIETNNQTELFIPTNRGLAKVAIDIFSLSFDVEYIKVEGRNKESIASPAYFKNAIWQLFKNEFGELQIIEYLCNENKSKLLIPEKATKKNFTNIQAPIITNNYIVWICDQGQIILQHNVNKYELIYLEWPSHLIPDFNFGCPYIDSTGGLFQLCIDEINHTKCYIKLKNPSFYLNNTQSIRICSGRYNFEKAREFDREPWIPSDLIYENEFSSSITNYFVPLIESHMKDQILGLTFEINADKVIDDIFNKDTLLNVKLELSQSRIKKLMLHFTVKNPFEIKFFMHSNYLFAYHPEFSEISGWGIKL